MNFNLSTSIMRKRPTEKRGMTKRAIKILPYALSALTILTLMFVLTLNASANEPKYDFPQGAVPVDVRLDGNLVLQGEAAIIDSVTYVPLRSFAELCGAESISWDNATRTATVKKGNMTSKITDRKNYVEASGRYFYLSTPVKIVSNRIFLPVRVASKLFCIDVDWNADDRCVVLKNTNERFLTGKEFYNSDDLNWLSKIISAESAGEPMPGKIAVGNVVINRKESNQYPNTIYGVIFDRKHGTQFSPVSLGTIYRQPTAESVIAAKICLEGYSLSDTILFFMNPRIATNNWISKNRPFAFTIGNHDFYN